MNLKYKSTYKSITKFDSIELEDFTIITGINGSGKSHLLESIKNGSCTLDNISLDEVVLFDYKTFYLENEKAFSNQQLTQEKLNAWNKLNGISNGTNYKQNLTHYKTQLGSDNYNKILELGRGKQFFNIEQKEFEDESLYQLYSQYKAKVLNFFKTQNIKNQPETSALKSLVLNIEKSIDDLSEDEFHDYYSPIILKNDFLPSQIGKVFIDYWYKYQIFLFTEVMKTKTIDEEKLKVKFEKKHGPRPWSLIENILGNFSSFNYTINNPENIVFNPARLQNFSLLLKHKTKNVSVQFDSLSSGEKILFSLVISIYKSIGDKVFPSILLLDEIDASLHPSQIQNLLNVINEVFVKQNKVKVILASHSPTTIALADEKSIYLVNNEGEKRIEKQTKKQALKILSEGFITLEEGLQIFDQVAKRELTIFTEGNNIEFIRKVIELNCPENINKIEIVDNLKDRTGKHQLSTLNDFFLKMPHKNKILFIYDCDVTSNFTENESTFSYIFKKNNDNNKVTKGIENLFDESLFKEEFYPIKGKDDGGIQSSLDKKKFEHYILERNKKEDFKNFENLLVKINEIIK